MKTFKLFLLGIFTIFALNSCVSAYAQYDDVYANEYVESHELYETIVLHGTPYYYNNVISYYYYGGLYYYPYLWDGYWYLQPFRHVHPTGFIFHPNRYHRPQHHLGDHHNKHPHNFGNKHHDGYRDRGHHNGGNGNNGYHNNNQNKRKPMDSSTRVTVRNNNNQQRTFTPQRNYNQSRTFTPQRSNASGVHRNVPSGGGNNRSGSFRGGRR